MNGLIRTLIKPVHSRYLDIKIRIRNLETAVDCLIDAPRYVDSIDIGFNGQANRKQIFQDLISTFHFDSIIETGTHIGNTTGYMAGESNLPVYTSEINERFYSLARMRLSEFENITFELGDSREFLRNIARSNIKNDCVFVYLDAHWYDELPLEEEIVIICDTWNDFVMMIDDFQVPDDPGYGFEDYGKGKTLSMGPFANVFSQNELSVFFPACPSCDETGKCRGCTVLTQGESNKNKLMEISSLKLYKG